MTLTLTVDRAAWEAHVAKVAAAYGAVLAVVKGNGYGFGLTRLAGEAVGFGLGRLAVGTVHELGVLPPLDHRPLVLTPATSLPEGDLHAVLTVGTVEHVKVLAEARGRTPVAVKLASSMQRYGVDAAGLPGLLIAVDTAGLEVDQFAVHLPLDADAAEVDDWLRVVPGDIPVSVSHLTRTAIDGLRARHPRRTILARLGSALWHGDKSFLSLTACVIDRKPVSAGDRAGYRLVEVPGDGTLVMIGAGSAHGVHPLPDGRSPFHVDRRRLMLLEPPHMHTSMVFVPAPERPPDIGDSVDVQQPLTFVAVDRIVER
jgi:alanine racemase